MSGKVNVNQVKAGDPAEVLWCPATLLCLSSVFLSLLALALVGTNGLFPSSLERVLEELLNQDTTPLPIMAIMGEKRACMGSCN